MDASIRRTPGAAVPGTSPSRTAGKTPEAAAPTAQPPLALGDILAALPAVTVGDGYEGAQPAGGAGQAGLAPGTAAGGPVFACALPGSDACTIEGRVERPILFFNEHCEVCKTIARWVHNADERGGDRIDERPIPIYQEELDAIVPGLDLNDVYTVSHLVMPDGRVLKGGEAVAQIFRELPVTRWFGWTFDLHIGSFHPFISLASAGYKFLDKIRPAIKCTSCGPNAAPTWAKPIEWVSKGVRAAIHGWRRLTGKAQKDAPEALAAKPELGALPAASETFDFTELPAANLPLPLPAAASGSASTAAWSSDESTFDFGDLPLPKPAGE